MNIDTECPICFSALNGIWGVVTPCGHAYHQECWNQAVANGVSTCALCNGIAGTFQRVYLDLDAADTKVTELQQQFADLNADKLKAEGDVCKLQHQLANAEAKAERLVTREAKLEAESGKLHKNYLDLVNDGVMRLQQFSQLSNQLAYSERKRAYLAASKAQSEADSRKALSSFQETYLNILEDCKMKLKDKHDRIEALEMHAANEMAARRREEKLISSAIFELGVGIMNSNLSEKGNNVNEKP